MNPTRSAWHTGSIYWDGGETTVASLPWNPHASFPGVALKHLVTGEQTGGRLSCHLVRIDPGCSVGDHCHEKSHELHEVIEGEALARVDGREIAYRPGMMVMVKEGVAHRIDAGHETVYILAKFTPALL